MSKIQFKNFAGETVTVEVNSLIGEVIAFDRATVTHVHGSGGGGRVSTQTHIPTGEGYGMPAFSHTSVDIEPISISSSNSFHDSVHLLKPSGEEVFIQLEDWANAGIRLGSQLQLMSLGVEVGRKKFSTDYVIVNNRTINKWFYKPEHLRPVICPSTIFQSAKAGFFLKPIYAFIFSSILSLSVGVVIIPPALLVGSAVCDTIVSNSDICGLGLVGVGIILILLIFLFFNFYLSLLIARKQLSVEVQETILPLLREHIL